MSFRILFVEDSLHKANKIIEYIESIPHDISITHALSFSSGSHFVENESYDFILMDLSLPTYDKTESDSGGRFRTFGGREIARKAFRNKVNTKIFFITQYSSFSDKGKSYSFDGYKDELASDGNINFGGMILYHSASTSWKEPLLKAIKEEILANSHS